MDFEKQKYIGVSIITLISASVFTLAAIIFLVLKDNLGLVNISPANLKQFAFSCRIVGGLCAVVTALFGRYIHFYLWVSVAVAFCALFAHIIAFMIGMFCAIIYGMLKISSEMLFGSGGFP